jgi:hypothetical protein
MKKPTALTDEEKRVIKALLADGMRNQDIRTLINYERKATINFGRTRVLPSFSRRHDQLTAHGPPLSHRSAIDLPSGRGAFTSYYVAGSDNLDADRDVFVGNLLLTLVRQEARLHG